MFPKLVAGPDDIKDVSAAFTATDSERIIRGNVSSAGFTITLPTAVGRAGKQFIFIKKSDGTTNALKIDGSGSELINEKTDYSLKKSNECIIIESDNVGWLVLGNELILDNRKETRTSGDFIGRSMKISQGETTTGQVVGLELSPRIEDTFGGSTITALKADPVLKGNTGNLSGDVRAIESNIDL